MNRIYQLIHLPSNDNLFSSYEIDQQLLWTKCFLLYFSDVGSIVEKLYPESAPPIMIVGHSMGGAICVHIASLELIPSLIGCVVIDVVEGTAMEALASMQSFLRSRPSHFKSIQQAIEWCIRSGQIRNTASAKVSMPGQIIK